MTDLKTLKDVEYCGEEGVCFCQDKKYSCYVASSVRLRQEAIKWIKADRLTIENMLDEETLTLEELNAIKKFIKKYNNLTEEDLK